MSLLEGYYALWKKERPRTQEFVAGILAWPPAHSDLGLELPTPGNENLHP